MLALPPTAEGDTASIDVTLTNDTSHPQSFQLKAPDGACLKLSPQVGKLAPGTAMRLLVEFTAPHNPDPTYKPYGQFGELDPDAIVEVEPAADSNGEVGSGEGEEAEEGAPVETKDGAGEEGEEEAEPEEDWDKPMDEFALKIRNVKFVIAPPMRSLRHRRSTQMLQT